MKPKNIIHLVSFTAFLVIQTGLPAAERSPNTLPNDPSTALAELVKMDQALKSPDEWRRNPPTPEQVAEFQKQVCETAWSYADQALEFIERFPTNENVPIARSFAVEALTYAVAAGDARAEERMAAFVSGVVQDQSVPEDDRVGILIHAGKAAAAKKIGMRGFTEGRSKFRTEVETASIKAAWAASKQFPQSSVPYTYLVSLAQRAKGERQKELALEIRDTPGAPAGVKTLADHILKGTKPYEVGKPLDIRFTALDGCEVDLAKLKGKVVLVQFWATSCGPCVAEMPTVKSAYQKLHDRGFEVVAISLDDKESALRRFIKEKELPWPQHFDGKGWENQLAARYGVFSIPTMWLVDKHGNLRDIDARSSLEQRVTALLGEQVRTPNK